MMGLRLVVYPHAFHFSLIHFWHLHAGATGFKPCSASRPPSSAANVSALLPRPYTSGALSQPLALYDVGQRRRRWSGGWDDGTSAEDSKWLWGSGGASRTGEGADMLVQKGGGKGKGEKGRGRKGMGRKGRGRGDARMRMA